ncbi:hypothetical protein [Chryseobacterium scophthalmum]|uniref:hypothetical protein n=1 Tax=Chryseobacterium scophthalmum TaxID=59733 RepID=UPI001AEBFE1C|nr:hypothetical protein [Chryseobacterium scophthalmum]
MIINSGSLRGLLDWYLNSSIHVAISTTALVGVTNWYAKLSFDWRVMLFVFFSTVCSYNITKYYDYIKGNNHLKKTLITIIWLTVAGLLICAYYFFSFKLQSQLVILFFAFLNFLYVIPVRKGKKNLRNISGIKIYIVSICWGAVTVVLPLVEADAPIQWYVLIAFIQRFILTLILILIFEIIDAKADDIKLRTVPQVIGVKKTKIVIYTLLFFFFLFDFFKRTQYENQVWVNLILAAGIIAMTYFARYDRQKYYTIFWVESIPVVWLILINITT